ncbi:MAG: hypothetical protein WD023_03925 [Ilumatobacteraceae bacterium]
MRLAAGGLLVVVVVAAAACSGDGDGAADATTAPIDSASLGSLVTAECSPGAPVLKIDQIPTAIAAVEAELGGPQRYFEINATDVLVNMFVAGPDATTVTPYVFAGGALTSNDVIEAQGNTFEASALDIDSQLVSSCVTGQLPTSSQDLFLVEGGVGGVVRYAILTTSANGGQLLIEVSGDGTVLSVDPVDG